jgi:hypothetical protein
MSERVSARVCECAWDVCECVRAQASKLTNDRVHEQVRQRAKAELCVESKRQVSSTLALCEGDGARCEHHAL